MAVTHLAATPVKAIRLWPGVALAVLLVLVRFVLPVVFPTVFLQAVLGSLLFALLIVLWWLFFSRAPWSARVGAIVLMVVALWTTSLLAHPSIAAGMGFVLPAYIAPVLGLALVGAAAGCRVATRRWVPIFVSIVLSCAVFTLGTDRRRDRRRRFAAEMAVDANGRRAAPGANARRTPAANVGGNCCRHTQ